MEVKEIYQHKSQDIDSEIFKLENGRLIIKHSSSQTNKLNIKQWEEINYIPKDYRLVDRELDKSEKKAIKKYTATRSELNNRSLPEKLIGKIKSLLGG